MADAPKAEPTWVDALRDQIASMHKSVEQRPHGGLEPGLESQLTNLSNTLGILDSQLQRVGPNIGK